MIERKFTTLLSCYTGIVDELAYPTQAPIRKWGVCLGHADILSIEIENMIPVPDELSLGVSGYTKSRWTRFLRRYFREDFPSWIDGAVDKLLRYPSRPFVASYTPNLETGHNYGGCLSSIQMRISPEPQVILYSRACQIDKIGFLDLCLIHMVAKRLAGKLEGYTKIAGGPKTIKGSWIISLPFISAISQIYYIQAFKRPLIGHRMEKTMGRLIDVPYEDIKYGPLMRGRKRMADEAEYGFIPRSILVKDLSLDIEYLEERAIGPEERQEDGEEIGEDE